MVVVVVVVVLAVEFTESGAWGVMIRLERAVVADWASAMHKQHGLIYIIPQSYIPLLLSKAELVNNRVASFFSKTYMKKNGGAKGFSMKINWGIER